MAEEIKVGVDTGDSQQELESLAKSLNDFLVLRGKAAGKPVRLLDLSEDIQELKEYLANWKEVINLNPTIRGPMNLAGQRAGNRPATPAQMLPMPGESAKDLERRITTATARLFQHHINTSKDATPPGLSYADLGPRAPKYDTPDPKQSPRKDHGSVGGAVQYLSKQAIAGGAGGGAGQALGAAMQGAGSGLGGFAGGGMAGLAAGAGIGLLGYGLYKGASAIGEGMDRTKGEYKETDRFKRSLGDASDSFKGLIDQSRRLGDAFLLTYDQSSKLTMGFAATAKVNDEKQVKVGVGLSQAYGVNESHGVDLMATLRRDKSIGETAQDAKMFGVQFAEALKRTGATLNAGDLMTALKSFSTSTAHSGLGPANMEAFAGILSAMAGSKTPGLDVKNSASILMNADAAFRTGGAMGDASETEQFVVFNKPHTGPGHLDGENIGLMGLRQRQAGGLLATEAATIGNAGSQSNKYLGRTDLAKYQGNKSALAEIAEHKEAMIRAGAMSREEALAGFSNTYAHGNVELGASMLNHANKGDLDKTLGMLRDHGVNFNKISEFGFEEASNIANNKNGSAGLEAIRARLAGRSGISDTEKDQLEKMKGLGGGDLKAALVKFTETMGRERTEGEQILENEVKISQYTQLIGTQLIPLSTKANELLRNMIEAMAPGSPEAKAIKEQRIAETAAHFASGKATAAEIAAKNAEYDEKERKARWIYPGHGLVERATELAQIKDERDRSLLGKNAHGSRYTGGMIGDETGSAKVNEGAIEAYKFYRGKGMSHEDATGFVANLASENSKFNPAQKQIGGGDGQGLMQWGKERQADFKKWSGGKNLIDATRQEQLEFSYYEITEGKEKENWDKIKGAHSEWEAGSNVSRNIERPKAADAEAIARGMLAKKIGPALRSSDDPSGGKGLPQESFDNKGSGMSVNGKPLEAEFHNKGEGMFVNGKPLEAEVQIPNGNPQAQSERNQFNFAHKIGGTFRLENQAGQQQAEPINYNLGPIFARAQPSGGFSAAGSNR